MMKAKTSKEKKQKQIRIMQRKIKEQRKSKEEREIKGMMEGNRRDIKVSTEIK